MSDFSIEDFQTPDELKNYARQEIEKDLNSLLEILDPQLKLINAESEFFALMYQDTDKLKEEVSEVMKVFLRFMENNFYPGMSITYLIKILSDRSLLETAATDWGLVLSDPNVAMYIDIINESFETFTFFLYFINRGDSEF